MQDDTRFSASLDSTPHKAFPKWSIKLHADPSDQRFSHINPKRLSILVLDDHRDTRVVLAWLLAELGHRVETVPDAGTTLDLLKQDGFDLLLTDVWLPRANGWSLLQMLRERGNLPPYVVSMSTLHVDDALESSRTAGCFAHLVQPFKIVEIEQMLERVCASSL